MKFTLLVVCVFLCSKFSFALFLVVASAACNDNSQIETVSTRSDLILTEPIDVAALGRFADLGDLYDARKDKFLDISLYSTDLSGDAVHSTDRTYSAIDYVRTESLSEKMEKLGVQGRLAVSFLSGLVSVSGSGKYLSAEKKSSKSAKTSLIYSTRTVRDELQIFSKTSRSLIDSFLLENIDATHVVVGIDWGTNVVVSFEETNTDSCNFKEVQGKLDGAVNAVALEVSGSAEVNINSYDFVNSSSFSFHVHGDIIPNTVPQSINESIHFIRSIPDLIKRENKGKGVAMNYVLMPLQTVQKVFQTGINTSIIVKYLNQQLIDRFMRIFEEMKDSKLEIDNVYDSIKTWMLMVPEREFSKISEIKSKFASFTNDLRTKFADLIVKYRSGDLDSEALVDLMTSYENSTWTPASTSTALQAFSSTMQKTGLLNLLQNRNAFFINRRTDKYEILEKNFYREIRIISADLNKMNISSPYVYSIIKLLNVEFAKKSGAIKYYIEDGAVSVPVVRVYLEGNVLRSFSVEKKEYVLLTDDDGKVIILDINSYEEITSYVLPELKYTSKAVVSNSFYSIDVLSGTIFSTNIENIMTGQNGVNWTQVGSFAPGAGWVRNGAAVKGSLIYFMSSRNILYSYDTSLKAVAQSTALPTYDDCGFLIIANNIFYIQIYDKFYSFDGVNLKEITTPETRVHPGLFQLENLICRIGGNQTDVYPDPVSCYDPSANTWIVNSYINDARHYPGVVAAGSKTYIFGGQNWNEWINSIEMFDPKTKIWSYIPSTLSIGQAYLQAVSFYF